MAYGKVGKWQLVPLTRDVILLRLSRYFIKQPQTQKQRRRMIWVKVSFQDVNNLPSSCDGGNLSDSPQMHITHAEPHVHHRLRQMVALPDLTSTGTPSLNRSGPKQADQKLWQKSARGSYWFPWRQDGSLFRINVITVFFPTDMSLFFPKQQKQHPYSFQPLSPASFSTPRVECVQVYVFFVIADLRYGKGGQMKGQANVREGRRWMVEWRRDILSAVQIKITRKRSLSAFEIGRASRGLSDVLGWTSHDSTPRHHPVANIVDKAHWNSQLTCSIFGIFSKKCAYLQANENRAPWSVDIQHYDIAFGPRKTASKSTSWFKVKLLPYSCITSLTPCHMWHRCVFWRGRSRLRWCEPRHPADFGQRPTGSKNMSSGDSFPEWPLFI